MPLWATDRKSDSEKRCDLHRCDVRGETFVLVELDELDPV